MTEEEKKKAKSEQNSRFYQSHKEYRKKYYETHKEYIRELQRNWRLRNHEAVKAKARARYAETHVRKRRSKYGDPSAGGKRVGLFLKAKDIECYQWLKEHFERQRLKEKEHEQEHEHENGFKN